MKLFDLFESATKSPIVFSFSNCNPPHAGHLGLVKFIVDTANQNSADWCIYLSESVGVMLPDQKVEWLVAWCEAAGISAKGHIHHVPKIHQSAIDLYQKGYRSAIFVAGEGDFSKYYQIIKRSNQYNAANVDPNDPKYFYFDELRGRENTASEGGAGRITSGTSVRTAAQQVANEADTDQKNSATNIFWKAASAGNKDLAKTMSKIKIGGKGYLQTILDGLQSGAKINRSGNKKAVT